MRDAGSSKAGVPPVGPVLAASALHGDVDLIQTILGIDLVRGCCKVLKQVCLFASQKTND